MRAQPSRSRAHTHAGIGALSREKSDGQGSSRAKRSGASLAATRGVDSAGKIPNGDPIKAALCEEAVLCQAPRSAPGKILWNVKSPSTSGTQHLERVLQLAFFVPMRILDSFPHKSTMAVDVAMQLCLRTPPLRREFARRITPKPQKPLRPCIHLKSNTELDELGEEVKCLQRKREKKRVSFADSRGLALTVVKVFSEFDESLDIPFNITELIDNIVGLSAMDRDDFVLDFVQPSADYLDFRNRLQADYVCLENCVLKDKVITGTVKVRNLAFEKAVKIRMTFDTWKTFTDYPCEYVKDTYAGSDKDTFSFDISLPERVQPHERIEFAVCYECNGKVFWDSNQGLNYRIVRSELKSARQISQPPSEPGFGIAFDQFGSPRCSYGLFPEWPSYSGYEKLGPYY